MVQAYFRKVIESHTRNLSSLESLKKRITLSCTSSLVWAKLHPSECQILTLATDGQLSYWEVIDGTEIRNIVLGKHSTVTSLDVAPGQGEYFITSTNDSVVKVIFVKKKKKKSKTNFGIIFMQAAAFEISHLLFS